MSDIDHISFTIEHIAVYGTGPNQRLHWTIRANRQKSLKGAAKILCVNAINCTGLHDLPWKGVDIEYVWHYARGRAPDFDNAIASLKPCLDGIVLAGLIEDDNNVIVRSTELAFVKGGQDLEVTLRRRPRLVWVRTYDGKGNTVELK